jgi:hypothetical protein
MILDLRGRAANVIGDINIYFKGVQHRSSIVGEDDAVTGQVLRDAIQGLVAVGRSHGHSLSHGLTSSMSEREAQA